MLSKDWDLCLKKISDFSPVEGSMTFINSMILNGLPSWDNNVKRHRGYHGLKVNLRKLVACDRLQMKAWGIEVRLMLNWGKTRKEKKRKGLKAEITEYKKIPNFVINS